MHANRFARMAGPLLATLLFGACGSDDKSFEYEEIPTPPTPAIIAFDVTPTAIEAGGSATLLWETRDVASLALVDGAGAPISLDGRSVEQGSVTVHPAATTSYTLTATAKDAGVTPAWRTVTVTVLEKAPASPEVVEFKATPATVAIGAPVTLSWRTTGATLVVIKDDAGHAVDLGDAGVVEGEVSVKPTRLSTTYSLSAEGPGGRDTAEVSVTVTDLPQIGRFDISPLTPIEVGGMVTLTWATSNATSVVIKQDGQSLVDPPPGLSGSRTITLSDSAVFTVVAMSAAGTAEARAEARVGPRVAAFSSTKRLVRRGDTVTFQWQLADANRATIDGPGGYHRDIGAAEVNAGSDTWSMTEPGDFVLRAFRGEVSQTSVVAVDVTAAPLIRSLTVDRPRITAANDRPGSAILAWAQDGGDTCTVYRGDVVVFDGPCGVTGTATVPIYSSAALRLEARNADGAHTATIGIETIRPARVVAFSATPNRRLAPGDSVQLSWAVNDAVSVGLAVKDGLALSIDPSDLDGTASDRIDQNTTYILAAKNALGDITSSELTVRAGAPEILAAVAEPSFVGIGDTFKLRWTADGGDLLTVTESGGTERLFETEEPAEIDQGSTDPLSAPLQVGTHRYTVRVANDGGAFHEKNAELTVSDGPIIVSFIADRSGLALGETLTLAWKVREDSDGTRPTLSLRDDYNHDFTDKLPSADPTQGTLKIQPAEEGTHIYTLEAETPNRMVHTRTVTVDVTAAPLLSEFIATPDRVGTRGGQVAPEEVVLSWRSENGVELQIAEVDAAGNIISSLHRVDDPSELAAGDFKVYPTTTSRYLARLWNRVGAEVDGLVTVWVDPPAVTGLVIEPDEIIGGETSTLTWATELATGVRIDPLLPTVTPSENAYVDISASGTFVRMTGGLGAIDFPDGFVFPFGGVNYMAIQVYGSGWAGFDLNNGFGVANPGTMPNDTYRYINFALYAGNRVKLSPSGEVHYKMHTDTVGDCLIIQWKNLSSEFTASSLNFELVLRPNGDFEYRYGTMSADLPQYAQGSEATLGFQFADAGSPGLMLAPSGTIVEGGLQNKGYSFQIARPANGSIDVTPQIDTVYTVTAFGEETTGTRQTSVKVWQVPAITGTTINPLVPEVGKPLTIGWTTTNATSLRLLDEGGGVLCTPDVTQIDKGSCVVTPSSSGLNRYTIEAINGIDRNVTIRSLVVEVFGALTIESLTAMPGAFVNVGQEITIAWQIAGAVDLRLYACTPGKYRADCVDVTPANAGLASGSHTQAMNGSVEFLLQAFDAHYRVTERTLTVWAGAGTIGTFEATETQIPSGGTTTLSWTSTNQTHATVVPRLAPFEVTDIAPFIDIGESGVATRLNAASGLRGYYNVEFPEDFAFPWFGKKMKALRAFTDGWITFDMTHTATMLYQVALPTATAAFAPLQISPFWGTSMFQKTANDTVRYQLFDPGNGGERYLVVMWPGVEFSPTGLYAGADLSFEVVLFESGVVDFRYGRMTTTSTTDAGKAATTGAQSVIGWQSLDRTNGQMLVASRTAMTGGLHMRSWRFPVQLPANGSITISPTESTTYTLCATNDSLYPACRDLRVLVIKPGDLLFSELMIAPASTDAEWIELRNMSPDAIDLRGWVLSSGGVPYTIPSSVVIEPDTYAVFSRSVASGNGGFEPAHVYGSDLTLVDAAGDVALHMGDLEIDSVEWTGAWNVPAGRSIAMEPTKMKRDPSCNDDPVAWCETTALYGNETYGGSPGSAGDGCPAAP